MQLISNNYQVFSSLDKHDNHIATTVEVRENAIMKYMMQISEPATNTCSNRNILSTHLSGRLNCYIRQNFTHQNHWPLHLSKFCIVKHLCHTVLAICMMSTYIPYTSKWCKHSSILLGTYQHCCHDNTVTMVICTVTMATCI